MQEQRSQRPTPEEWEDVVSMIQSEAPVKARWGRGGPEHTER